MTGRLMLATILGSITAVLAAWAGFVASGAVALLPQGESLAAVAGGGWFLLRFFVAFWLPLALVGTLLAIPFYWYLRNKGWLSRRNVLILATVWGGIAVVLVWTLMFGFVFGLTQLPSGLLAGGAAGLIFWMVALRSRLAAPAA